MVSHDGVSRTVVVMITLAGVCMTWCVRGVFMVCIRVACACWAAGTALLATPRRAVGLNAEL